MVILKFGAAIQEIKPKKQYVSIKIIKIQEIPTKKNNVAIKIVDQNLTKSPKIHEARQERQRRLCQWSQYLGGLWVTGPSVISMVCLSSVPVGGL